MKLWKQTFRLWWQEPRKIKERQEDRSVSFLELFYDLSYVAILARLTHALIAHPSMKTFIAFAGLFTLVWIAWINGSFYHELHGNNDIRTRIFTFLQMFSLAGMAIFAHGALGGSYQAFALSFTLFLITLTYLWWRTGYYDPEHKPLARPYTIGYITTTILFFISIFTPVNTAILLWTIGTLISLVLPFFLMFIHGQQNIKQVQEAQYIHPSLVERFGLLTIIMLGEGIVSLVNVPFFEKIHYSHAMWYAFLGISLIIGLWWLYFDFISQRLPKQKVLHRISWINLHLPLTLSIALVDAAILYIFNHADSTTSFPTWLLSIPLIVFIISISLLLRTLDIPSIPKETLERSQHALYIAMTLLIGVPLILPYMSLNMIFIIHIIILFIPIIRAFNLWVISRSQHIQN